MDFNAKRLALLAGVGNSEDRHDIVREYAQQLNESAEARQLNEAEEAVRKAVRRTIQKMISEGAINLQEDSIARELEHLRANIKADHDHLEALVRDMHDDRDEIERAEHHREEMHEEEGYGITGGAMHVFEDEDKVSDADLADDEEYDADEGDDEEYDLDDDGKLSDEEKAKRDEHMKKKAAAKKRVKAVVQPAFDAISESDASLMRLQKLAGVQILAEGRDEDVDEGSCQKHEDEDHMEEGELEEDVMETQGFDRAELKNSAPTGRGPAPRSMAYEGEDHDEAKLYELEDGRMYMEMGGKKFMMQEMEEELNELEEEDTHYVGKDSDGNDVVSVDGKLGRVQ